MRSVVCQHAAFAVADGPEATPGSGQVRLEVLRCGICGSDLHARHGLDEWADMAQQMGYERFGRSAEPIVFGHEFCGGSRSTAPAAAKTCRPGHPWSRCRCFAGQTASTRSGCPPRTRALRRAGRSSRSR